MVAGGVTGGRLVLLSVWPQFKKATDSSNKQALMPLQSVLDVVLVATLPAFSEEYLFRGALFPAIYPDWRGAVISGCVFGSLHITGNRNIAFAAWASLVGFVYGMSFLATGNLAVPMIAHSVSNIASAVLWLERNKS
jgi:membrane protease YdiL (CAAX protease family)